jgi:hypothetical protein
VIACDWKYAFGDLSTAITIADEIKVKIIRYLFLSEHASFNVGVTPGIYLRFKIT